MLALVVVALYLAALVGVGVVKSRRVHDQEGFTLAGRGLGPLVLLGTLLATWTGTGSIFANAEKAYEDGLPALVLPLSSAAGILVLIVLAPRVRAFGSFTLQDLLEDRFGPAARVAGTITLVAAYLVIVSYQLRAAAAVMDGVLARAGWEVPEAGPHGSLVSLGIVAVLIGTYTALAGMMSVAVTDGFNGALMIAGIGLALPLAWVAAGGTDGVVAALPETGRALTGPYSTFDYLSILLPAFLLVIGDANLHQRFFSARDARAARAAALLLVPGVLLVDGLILLTACAGRAVLPGLEQPGSVVLELALTTLPPFLGALLVAAIVAIIVSTADSFLLSSSASLVRDVYQRFLHQEADGRTLLRAARVAVAFLTLAAFGLALTSDRFFDTALFAYTLYGVGITPPLLAAFLWPRATPAGALASMVTATSMAVAWRAGGWGDVTARALDLPEGTRVGAVVPCIVVSVGVLVGVSLVTRPRALAA